MNPHSSLLPTVLSIALTLNIAAPLRAAGPPPAPVPKSPYIAVVYRFADTLLDRGRDTHGAQRTPLFVSALDRTTLAPLERRPPAPGNIPEVERAGATNSLAGSNLQHDENLFRLLYLLSELTNKPKYRDAADAALTWFFTNTQSAATGLLPWGNRLSWDTALEQPTVVGDTAVHQFYRPWLLWERCFALAPAASRHFAEGLWEHQIADPKSGAFDRQTGYFRHAPRSGPDTARDAGFYIRTWAMAHSLTRRTELLRPIDVLLGRFEQKRHPTSGWIDGDVASELSMAIDCDGASRHVPEPLASTLKQFADQQDTLLESLRNVPSQARGFVTHVDRATGKPVGPATSPWINDPGLMTTAQFGMLCVSRYDNTGKIAYRDLLMRGAEEYLEALPRDSDDVLPRTFGHAISLELAAWRHGAAPRHLEAARRLADFAVAHFWGTNALPRASIKSDHYESVTGADTLALALVELHLQVLHITAVRCPPNTIDR